MQNSRSPDAGRDARIVTVGTSGAMFTLAQAGINAAVALSPSMTNPVCVDIGPGTYTERLVIPPNTKGLTLNGAGMYQTLITQGSSPAAATTVTPCLSIGNGSDNITLAHMGFTQSDEGMLLRLSDTAVTSGAVDVHSCYFNSNRANHMIDGYAHESMFSGCDFAINSEVPKSAMMLANGETAWSSLDVQDVTCTTDTANRYKWDSSAKLAITGTVSAYNSIAEIACSATAAATLTAATQLTGWIRTDWITTGGAVLFQCYAGGVAIGGTIDAPATPVANVWTPIKATVTAFNASGITKVRVIAGSGALSSKNIWINDLVLSKGGAQDNEFFVFDSYPALRQGTNVGCGDWLSIVGCQFRIRMYNDTNTDFMTLGVLRSRNTAAQQSFYFSGNRIDLRGHANTIIEAFRCEGFTALSLGPNVMTLRADESSNCRFYLLEGLESTSKIVCSGLTINPDAPPSLDGAIPAANLHTIWQPDTTGVLRWRDGHVYNTADIPTGAAGNEGTILYDHEAGVLRLSDGTATFRTVTPT